MNIELSEAQAKEIALTWIRAQQRSERGAQDVLDALFIGAHFAVWSWLDLIQYTVRICSKQYAVKVKDILEMLK